MSTMLNLIIQLSSQITLDLYPNPSNEIISVSISGAEGKLGSILISDIYGRQILSITANENGINKINTSQLDNGYYLLRYLVDGEIQVTKSLIVQH